MNTFRNKDKKSTLHIMGMIMFFLFAGIPGIYAAIPALEREALIELYNATNGDFWINNSGWKDGTLEPDGFGPIGSEDNWTGVKVSEDHVSELILADLDLDGNIPTSLENLSHLKVLLLHENRLTGSIPSGLGNLSHLENLSLRLNQLSDSIPPELANLSQLKILDLSLNRLTGTIPPQLGSLANLENLILSGNQLSGSIPPELASLSKLTLLNLYWNNLTGSIPTELADLENLEAITLSNNRLSGSIPPQLANLVKLTVLQLDQNQLSGSIPPRLGSLSQLERLTLSSNNLSGNIPPELGNLSHLVSFALGSNNLSGNIPAGLSNLTASFFNISYNALYTDNEELEAFLTSKDQDWAATQTIAPTNVSAAGTSLSTIRLSWTPISYTQGPGSYRIYYSTTSGGPWIFHGETADKNISHYDLTGLDSGTTYYLKVQTQTQRYSKNLNSVLSDFSNIVSAVTLSPLAEKAPPFGSFDTPIDGLTATGSIPVTGWSLDDSGIESVKIYRELGSQLIYIGDTLFVEGARPDVAAAFSEYPRNTKAGWGYMLLTNFLPNSGNGTFVLHAVATDVKGKTVTLGTKTIHCDNANAAKPFGAIDTPTQGGAASGTDFVNFGWALTPQPNTIPTDGSTITVWVDGVALGNPVYNQYREDIATLFPGYNNTSGAIGYFYIDTTAYQNGVHTIQWTVSDDAGNFDGIGSRYFTVNNTQNRDQSNVQAKQYTHRPNMPDLQVRDIPLDTTTPLKVSTGFNAGQEKQFRTGDPLDISIPELGRVKLILDDGNPEQGAESRVSITGYQIIGSRLLPLPAGSFLDPKSRTFYWQPGLAFLGSYHFVFIKTDTIGNRKRISLTVSITPKQQTHQ